MATIGSRVILYFGICAVLIFAGCVMPAITEAPLLSPTNPARNYNISVGQTEHFRLEKNGSTPEYALYAKGVQNLTALFTITPGNIPVALAEKHTELVDLDGNGAPDITIYLDNTTETQAYITVSLATSSQICLTSCPTGQLQYAYPDCACYSPVQVCSNTCPANQTQRPYPDCSCFTPTQFCSDNTAYGACSTTKPKYCEAGTLVDRCGTCGCTSGLNCNATSGNCYVPPTPTPTPTPAPTASPGASATPTPVQTQTPAGEDAQAVAAANASAEGGLMVRFDSLYKKNTACSQQQFISTFTTKKGREPNTGELIQYTSAKNYLPTSVTTSVTREGAITYVTYTHYASARQVQALKVTVVSGAATAKQWLDGTTTAQNTALIVAAESYTGNCGLVMAVNGW